MPPVKRVNGNGNGAPSGEITPEEVARIRASVEGKEQAPSTKEQASFVDWRQAADQLGQPFNVEKIPISKLRAMRRDPMLGFGLAFIKTPIVRAKWFINAKSPKGANAQISAHLDHDLRRVYPSLVLTDMNKLDFGFQAIAKRFELRTPSATYTETDPETGEQTQKPVWSEGSVQPIAWKPFVGLAPELVEPIWGSDGEFDGIRMFIGEGGASPGGVSGSTSGSGNEKKLEIDVYHALWSTNEREANFGSLFGYPRLGYAYRYWWSYWFRWAIADRAFEKKADPSIVVRHPSGDYIDEERGIRIPYRDYALMIGDRLRSGSSVALPSVPYLGEIDGKPSGIREWDIEFLRDGTDFEPFDKSFDYLDIQKLRSLFIPEQAFLEGKGGTSSRNVAAEQRGNFTEQQSLLAQQLVESINRWTIPQWLATNYPEFVAEGGKAEMVMQGFAEEDLEFTRQVIQLVGQQESGAREIAKLVDLKRVLEDAGTPIASFEEQQRRLKEIEAEQAAAQPPEVTPGIGQVGTVPSALGFSYINPREVVYLSDTPADFLDKLPATPHYADREVRSAARQLWSTTRDLYRDEYDRLITALAEGTEPLVEPLDRVDLAAEEFLARATEIVRNLPGSVLWRSALERAETVFERIARRAAAIELGRVGAPSTQLAEEYADWQREHIAETASKMSQTTRLEMRDFIAAQLAEGVVDRQAIATAAREHFMGFPDWKADRTVRTEVRDIYNVATLLSGRDQGFERAQALDGQGDQADPDCIERDGQLFSIEEALAQDEHPNGTLGWRLVPLALSIERSDEIDGAEFNDETYTVTFSDDMDPEAERKVLKSVIDHLYVMPPKPVAS